LKKKKNILDEYILEFQLDVKVVLVVVVVVVVVVVGPFEEPVDVELHNNLNK
jgi:hypothetical protein